jgi:hypothetical protein
VTRKVEKGWRVEGLLVVDLERVGLVVEGKKET